MPEPDDLNKLVNASGFAFQLGVEHAVRQRRGHRWRVVSRESNENHLVERRWPYFAMPSQFVYD